MSLVSESGWKRPRGAALVAALFVMTSGCDTAPTSSPTPPSGGQEFVMSFATFDETIHPILVSRGCNTAGDCHGGGIRGTFELSPPDDVDVDFDFAQTVLQVNGYAHAESPLLTKPLAEAAGGTPHSHEPFASTDDPDYQTILAWIDAGAFR